MNLPSLSNKEDGFDESTFVIILKINIKEIMFICCAIFKFFTNEGFEIIAGVRVVLKRKIPYWYIDAQSIVLLRNTINLWSGL